MAETENSIQIILVDDHALVRNGIKSLLEDEEKLTVIGEASNGIEAIEKVKKTPPDVLIVDIKMPNMTGIELIKQLTTLGIKTRFLMLSMHDSEEYVLQSIDAGAHGYLLKDANREEFLKAIKTVNENDLYFSGDVSRYLVSRYRQKKITKEFLLPATGASPTATLEISLTKREMQVLKLAASGMTNKEIADHLNKSKRTVEAHRFNLMKKLGVKNLMELISKGRMLGLLD